MEEMAIISAIVSAVITGVFSLVAVIITSSSNNKKIEHKIQISQAVTDAKLDMLTSEVRKHNNFAERVPVLEEQMKVANHRLTDLEGCHKE